MTRLGLEQDPQARLAATRPRRYLFGLNRH